MAATEVQAPAYYGANGTAGLALWLFTKWDGWIRSIMKRTGLGDNSGAQLLVEGAMAQAPPANEEAIPPRTFQLSAQQDYIIKENVKDMHVEQVPRTKEIRIGAKVLPNIGLRAFPPFVVKVPQMKTYKFFIA